MVADGLRRRKGEVLPAVECVSIMPRGEETRNSMHDINRELVDTTNLPERHSRPYLLGIDTAQTRLGRSIYHRNIPTLFASVIGWEIRKHEVVQIGVGPGGADRKNRSLYLSHYAYVSFSVIDHVYRRSISSIVPCY